MPVQRMNLDSSLLLSRFRMSSNALEQNVGEQCYSCGIYDLKPIDPA